ncbi:MAG: Na(+)-translocating NADH-quinone reductase subunit A [bacterium]|nr:Na(+)-translocating NADH-quinone reductase subunit A [bacterium]
MAVHTIRKGLDLPITGAPEQRIDDAASPKAVALIAADYVGMKPTMFVSEGDAVKRGQALFEDKKTPGVMYTSPGAGTVTAVNRGAKRALQSVVVELNERERTGTLTEDDEVTFESFSGRAPEALSRDEIRALLIESGMWTAFRTRPFSKVPAPESEPFALFITAIDTDPLAPSVETVLKGKEADFERGLLCVAKLCEGKSYLCRARGADVPYDPNTGIFLEEFEGPHPTGLVGLHIHRLSPVHRERTAWHVNYQDVVAIGRLFATGKLDVERTVSLAGPVVKEPRLLRTRLGASTDNLCEGQVADGDNRFVSGSVLSGRSAVGPVHGYLGRYHHQVSALREGHDREFMGWMAPGTNKFSVLNLFMSRLMPGKKFDFTTTANGSHRAIVPLGLYERVMPMDIIPTYLVRSMIAGDVERSEELGCLELDEEDLALCTFVCPSKIDYGTVLRDMLNTIEKEG